MKIDKDWRKYYEENVENEELCYEVVENAYSFGRKIERKRIVKEIKKLKKDKNSVWYCTTESILNKLLKIIQ